MPKAVNRPSEEQAEQFDECVRHWQTILNLMDWRLERSMKPAHNAMASIQFDNNARLGTYQLGDFGAAPINNQTLSMTALHECLHVLLYDLITVAQDRSSSPEEIESAEHRVINVLERVLYACSNNQ